MKAIIELLETPVFWFGTVIAGVLINIISHWVIKNFPDVISYLSNKWATRTEKMALEREERIKQLANNPNEQIYQMTEALCLRSMANQYYLITILLLVLDFMLLIITVGQKELYFSNRCFFAILLTTQALLLSLATNHIFEASQKTMEVRESKSREARNKL